MYQRRNPDPPQSQIQIRRIQLACLRPLMSLGPGRSRRPLSYEVTKRSNNGGGNPHRLEVFDECRTEGWGYVGWDRREGDESPKVQDMRSSLRVVPMVSSGGMIRVHVRDLAWDWLKNYLELPYSELNVSLVSIVSRGHYTPRHLPFSSCHHEGPSSRFELRETVQVVGFTLSPDKTLGAPRTLIKYSTSRGLETPTG